MKDVEVIGLERLQRNLRRLGDRAPKVLGQFLYEEAETIMARSKEIVPIDTGALEASGHVQLPKRTSGGMEVTLAYGGASAPYAIYVHEDLKARHKPGKTAKYLEIPFKQRLRGMVGRLARRIRMELRRVAR